MTAAPRHRCQLVPPRATGLRQADRLSARQPEARPRPADHGLLPPVRPPAWRCARPLLGDRARQDSKLRAARRVAGWSMPFRANSAARAALKNHITYGA